MGDFVSENPLVVLIAACEIGFWALLGAGLTARYVLRLRRTSAVVLLLVPVLDLVLVTASTVDVAGGTRPGLTHGLAAVYLGVTVAFGHSMIRWADVRMAHRFADGPAPVKPPRHGAAKVAHEWREWRKMLVAAVIALVVMAVIALVAGIGVPAPAAWLSDPFWTWGARVALATVIWFAVGPLWTTIAPPRDREPSRG
ncbi:MAG: hypothetical protein J0I34_09785 [Pseudonocardia sp.]|uniref:hypothetical protein n=1 Tax=unclassified Pseudonocardia TaxID=2619320 RepID=UPI00086E5443|nr:MULTISPECIES: hypothetical protein [unclassified Pseudonocardia]MBN9109062.1 hypothetical protein [Pseudonocardia sp.]ODU20936.1 MAG: hypothetical protein ABS80_17960 [Pseudonocardia sp. SCN 72-51]ODV02617.1 MAG: hypothetical protein ABT15_25190 [Pseudonocardia sp. SCN 73-27]